MSLFQDSGLNQNILDKLDRAGLFTYKKIIELSEFELREIASLTTEECVQVQEEASKLFLKTSFQPVSQVVSLSENKRITLDCPIINQLLGGGIPIQGVTELYGESGAGKTQICLQLSLTVQYPENKGGMNAGAVFICTEDKYPTNRLSQMINYFPRDSDLKNTMKRTSFGDNIFVDHIADIDGLKECLFHRLPRLLSNTRCGIVILDSIAALYRTEYSFKQTLERAKSIRNVALQLHRINRKFNLAVLCINQVSDSMDNSNEKIPALGLVWANMVTTRIQAYRYPKRALKVVNSPDLPSEFAYYYISEKGVFGSLTPSD